MKKKKIIVFLVAAGIFILATILIIFVLFFTSKNKTTSPIINIGNVKYPHLGKNNTIFYFDSIQTNFYKVEPGVKEPKSLTDDNFITVQEVVWSSQNDKVLIKALNHQYPYKEKLSPISDVTLPEDTKTWWLFDFNTKKASKIDQGINEIIFSPNGDKITFSTENGVYMADPDGQNIQKLQDLKLAKPVDWSQDNKKILLIVNEDTPYMVVYDFDSKSLTIRIDKVESGKFSPNAKKIFFSSYIDFDQKKLMLFDMDSKKSRDLEIETSFEKLTWLDDNKIIAAVSEQKENFYSIDTLNNLKKKIFYSTDRTINAINLIVNSDKKTLYFTSDDYLYQLELK